MRPRTLQWLECAEREVAEADARGRAVADPYGLAHRPGGIAALTQPAESTVRNGFGLAAAIIAPIGILFGLVPLTGFIAVICALVAIPLALVGRSRVRRGRATNGKTAVTGLVLGAGALALGVWGITIVFGAVDQLAEDVSGPAPIAAPAAPGPGGQQPAIEAEQLAGDAAPAVATFGQRVTVRVGRRGRGYEDRGDLTAALARVRRRDRVELAFGVIASTLCGLRLWLVHEKYFVAAGGCEVRRWR